MPPSSRGKGSSTTGLTGNRAGAPRWENQLNSPPAHLFAERLNAIRALLLDIQTERDRYNDAQFEDMVNRLNSRIAELEHEVRDSEITILTGKVEQPARAGDQFKWN